MIEQALIFGLGFLAAGLLVLFFWPSMWGRAMRLSRQRLERQLPLSIDEVIGERDRIRAESALAQRRIEQRAERVLRAHADHLVELGRRAVRIVHLETETRAQAERIEGLDRDLNHARQIAVGQEAELGALHKEIYNSDGLLDHTRRLLDEALEEQRRLAELAEERRGEIASLQTLAEGAQAKIEFLDRKLANSDRALFQKIQDLQLVSTARDAAHTDVGFLQMRRSVLEARVESQTAKLAELEAARARAEQERDTAVTERAGNLGVFASRDEHLAAQAARIAALEGKLAASTREARDIERRVLQQVETLRAEKASLEGALEVARRNREAGGGRQAGADTSVRSSLSSEMPGPARTRGELRFRRERTPRETARDSVRDGSAAPGSGATEHEVPAREHTPQ